MMKHTRGMQTRKVLGYHVLKIIISSNRSTPTNKSFQGLHPQPLNKKYYHPNAIFREKIANLLTIFYGPKLQPFIVQFLWTKIENPSYCNFSGKSCKPSNETQLPKLLIHPRDLLSCGDNSKTNYLLL